MFGGNNYGGTNLNDASCGALIKTKMAGGVHEAKVMLELDHLLQAHKYKRGILVGARGVRTLSTVIFDTSTGPKF